MPYGRKLYFGERNLKDLTLLPPARDFAYAKRTETEFSMQNNKLCAKSENI